MDEIEKRARELAIAAGHKRADAEIVCVGGVLVCAKAETPNALPRTRTGRPKVVPDFIMFYSPVINESACIQASTCFD